MYCPVFRDEEWAKQIGKLLVTYQEAVGHLCFCEHQMNRRLPWKTRNFLADLAISFRRRTLLVGLSIVIGLVVTEFCASVKQLLTYLCCCNFGTSYLLPDMRNTFTKISFPLRRSFAWILCTLVAAGIRTLKVYRENYHGVFPSKDNFTFNLPIYRSAPIKCAKFLS
jgi:hypothetical protein